MSAIEPIDGFRKIVPVQRPQRPVERDPADQEPSEKQDPRERREDDERPPPASGDLVDVRI